MSLSEIQKRINSAETQFSKPIGSTKLIAVSKVQPIERIKSVLDQGHRVFGENRVQEAQSKWPEFKEQYHSISNKNVVRGLHFQLPPYDHAKLVYCTDSEVMDFVLDIRLGSPTYGKYFSTKLNFEKGNMIYIPSGCAHGFCTLDKKATLIYNVTTIHNFDFDMGIKWDSAGIIWPIENPIVSEKDQSFPIFKNFSSPFIFNVLEK